MPKLTHKYPSYRRHYSGQGIVTLDGKDYYCGPYEEQASRDQYDEYIARWLANGRRMPDAERDPDKPITINELVVAFWDYAETYYRKPDGTATTEISNLKTALKPLLEVFGETEVEAFGPKSLKALQQHMVGLGWCRLNINRQVSKIKGVFKWGASEELLPGSLYQDLLAVSGLRIGRTKARESEPIQSVSMDLVTAIKEHVSRQVWAMVQTQLHCGARPGEIVGLRPVDIDRSGDVWSCQLNQHKTAHHGHDRVLYFGPKAQAVLQPFLEGRAEDEPLFSPQDAVAEHRALRHKMRKTSITCGNRPGTNRKKSPKIKARDAYDVASYRRAITRGCDHAFPPPDHLKRIKVKGVKGERWERDAEWKARLGTDLWEQLKAWRREHRWHPHQLRHTAATNIQKEHGYDAARAVLGHKSLAVTAIYVDRDHKQAAKVMAKIG